MTIQTSSSPPLRRWMDECDERSPSDECGFSRHSFCTPFPASLRIAGCIACEAMRTASPTVSHTLSTASPFHGGAVLLQAKACRHEDDDNGAHTLLLLVCVRRLGTTPY